MMSMYIMSDPTTTTTAVPPIGQVVALAHRALSQRLDGLLGEAGIGFEDWMTLNTVAVRGPSVPAGALRRELGRMLQVEEPAVGLALDRLEAAGWTRPAGAGEEAGLELTAGGAAFHGRVREALARSTTELLGPLDPRDVDTTVRVLRSVTERAESGR
jgi:DNA-binding MarR family transcriptional regulator